MNKEIEEKIDFLSIKYLENKGIYKDYPGYIEIFWNVKKQMYKNIYNYDWKSPKDLEPDTIFD